MRVTPKERRQARAFLYQIGVPAQVISPEDYAGAAKDLGLTFAGLWEVVVEVAHGIEARPQPKPEILRPTAFVETAFIQLAA